jgi:hypothetical protein
MKKTVFAFIVTILIALPTQPTQALDLAAFSGRFGVGIMNIAYDSEEQSQVPPPPPSPVSVSTLGGSMTISFAEDFFLGLEPALDLLWTNYQWFDGRRAVPTEYEESSDNNAFILGFIIDLPLVASFRINDRLGGSFGLGPAFLLRAAFAGDPNARDDPDLKDNISSILSYFWSEGRWFYPSATLRMNVFLQEGFTFGLGVRGSMPVFNAWTKDVGFWDHGMLHITLGMIIDR